MLDISWVSTDTLKPNPRNARTHSRKQVGQIANSVTTFGFVVPILVDENDVIIAGHGRHAAAKLLGLKQVPTIKVTGLSEAKRRALALADNRIAENAGWDREILAAELPELAEILVVDGLDISITGFPAVEIDQLAVDFEENASDPDDAVDPAWANAAPVSQPGDLWHLGRHRLLCGDARKADDLDRLMGGSRAAMAFLDPPYNVSVRSIVGRGQVKHAEFAMASGELSRAEFVSFLETSLERAATISRDGAVHYVCMDWRHVGELLEAGGKVYDEMLNLAVWVKSNRRSRRVLSFPARAGRSFPGGRGSPSQQYPARKTWSLPFERLELCRSEHVSGRPPRRSQITPDGQAGGAGGGRREGLYPAR